MAPDPTPRQIVKELLQGNAPLQPLFLPITFSLGSRIENLALRDFLQNPTKIANALRQIRSYLRCDGLACYFDPYLEAEALGGKLEWDQKGFCARFIPPPVAEDFRRSTGALQEICQRGRVPVALEVIRRLKLMMRDEWLLMARTTGPWTISLRLLGLEAADAAQLPSSLDEKNVEFAAEVTGQIASQLVDAGANVLFIVEEALPPAGHFEWWRSLLAPVFNVIRFYEALPVLLLTNKLSVEANLNRLLDAQWDCVLCPVLASPELARLQKASQSLRTTWGVALPITSLDRQESDSESTPQVIRDAAPDLQPALITTAGDIPSSADMKYLSAKILELRRHNAF